MKNMFVTCLACLAILVVMSLSASAQQLPTPWDGPMQTQESRSQMPAYTMTTSHQAPPILSVIDPDHTGYPYINNWKGNLIRDPRVFLNDRERQNLTQARVDLTIALAPLFVFHQNAIRSFLTPQQRFLFDSLVGTQDMEQLSVMTGEDRYVYANALSQRLHLDGEQEYQLRSVIRHLMRDVFPLQATCTTKFDQVMASAEQRVLADRAARNAISTENR